MTFSPRLMPASPMAFIDTARMHVQYIRVKMTGKENTAINQLKKTAIGRQYVDNSTAVMIKYRSNMVSEY